jgi:hypothetical protein
MATLLQEKLKEAFTSEFNRFFSDLENEQGEDELVVPIKIEITLKFNETGINISTEGFGCDLNQVVDAEDVQKLEDSIEENNEEESKSDK